MARLNTEKCKKLCQLKKPVCLFTHHHDGDKYHGIMLSYQRDLILLEVDNDFVFDGVVALPTHQIKFLRYGGFEKTLAQIFSRFKLFKKRNHPSWLKKVKDVQQLISECYGRKLWPVVEIQFKKINALYIGPITSVEKNYFHIFAYDATGKWEKNYKLSYKEILKVQLFDKYSTYFNRFMRENPKTKILLKRLFERRDKK